MAGWITRPARLPWSRRAKRDRQRSMPPLLEPGAFVAVTLRRSLVSWDNLVRTPDARSLNLLNTVHGALRLYDLPDLAATLPPGKLTIEAPVDAQGNPAHT